jgi:hypothetical protein
LLALPLFSALVAIAAGAVEEEEEIPQGQDSSFPQTLEEVWTEEEEKEEEKKEEEKEEYP